MEVIKRDGTVQPFDFLKIQKAVTKAFKSVDKEPTDEFLGALRSQFKQDEYEVEEIQDIIQNQLISSNCYDVVESFIIYRNKHAEIRERKSDLIKNIQAKLKGTNIENQNANVDEESFGGRLGEATRVVVKNDALKYVMSSKVRKLHESGEAYIHDLDSYSVGMHNCLSCLIDRLLNRGFKTQQADVRPAGSVGTALQLVAVIFQCQSLNQFGGVSATHLDWTMVPFVRMSFWNHWRDGMKYFTQETVEKPSRDELRFISIDDERYKKNEQVYKYALDMTKREVDQAAEGLLHNLNTLQSRSGNQLPFTSINYGTCTLSEGRMITRSILEQTIKGLGKFHRTSIFPCQIFQYKKGINDKPGTPNYDLKLLALESTAKRIYPNYANCDWSNQVSQIQSDRKLKRAVLDELDPEDMLKLRYRMNELPRLANALYLCFDENGLVAIDENEHPYEIFSTMGCRTANGFDINFCDTYKKNLRTFIDEGKLADEWLLSGAQKDGRGNICPMTLILPVIAMKADRDVEKFMKRLSKRIDDVAMALIERYNHICSQSASAGKFMYDNGNMCGYDGESIESALKHGTLAIGQLGLAEALELLIGTDHTTTKGMELAKRIEELFLEKANYYKQRYSLNFGVYYTPAENLCYTAMKSFKKKYGEIKNVSDKEYFTNSIHVPVYREVDAFKKIDIESELTGFSNAGCITYVELPSTAHHNIEAMEAIVDYMMDKDVPYAAINTPNDVCMDCGYRGEIEVCPECGSKNIERLRRVTGYLSTDYHRFNAGKIAETEARVKHVN